MSINQEIKDIIKELNVNDVEDFDEMLGEFGIKPSDVLDIGCLVKDAYSRLGIDESKLINIMLYNLGYKHCYDNISDSM